MSFPVQNIRDVCKERGTTLAEVERKLNIGNGVIARWAKQKGSPPIERIIEIANFLEVPVSRLIGTKDLDTAPDLGDFAYAMQAEAADLTEEQKRMLLDMARFLRKQKEEG